MTQEDKRLMFSLDFMSRGICKHGNLFFKRPMLDLYLDDVQLRRPSEHSSILFPYLSVARKLPRSLRKLCACTGSLPPSKLRRNRPLRMPKHTPSAWNVSWQRHCWDSIHTANHRTLQLPTGKQCRGSLFTFQCERTIYGA